jgi:hypothetical protein
MAANVLVNVDDHVLSPNNTCGSLHLQPGLDSREPPEAHLIVIARERDHETNLPNASDIQALSQSDGRLFAQPRRLIGLKFLAFSATLRLREWRRSWQ